MMFSLCFWLSICFACLFNVFNMFSHFIYRCWWKSTSKTVSKKTGPLWVLILSEDMVGSTKSAKSLEWVWANISSCFVWYTFMNMISCFLSLLTHSTVTPWKSVPQTLTEEKELRTFLNELKLRREVECTKAGGLGTWWGGQDNPHPCSQTEFGHTYTGKWSQSSKPPLPSPPLPLPSPSPPLPRSPPSPPLPSPPLPSPPSQWRCSFIHSLKLITRLWTTIKAPKSIKTVGCDRTVGVDLSMIKLAHGDVSVWDFGGQLEYAVTHQFLLSVEVIQKTIISSSHLLVWSYISWNRWWSTSCVMICRPRKRCKSSSAHTGSTSFSPPSHHPTRADRSGECSWWERRAKRPLCQGISRIPCHHGSRNGPTSHSTISTFWCHHSRTKEWKHWLKAWSMSAPPYSSNTPPSFHEPTRHFLSPSRLSRKTNASSQSRSWKLTICLEILGSSTLLWNICMRSDTSLCWEMVWCAHVLRSFRRSRQSSSHHWKCGTDCRRTTTFISWMRSR